MKDKKVTWTLKVYNGKTDKTRNVKFKGTKHQLVEKIDKIRNRNASVSVIATDTKHKRGLSDGLIVAVSSKVEENELERMKNEPLTVKSLMDIDEDEDDFEDILDGSSNWRDPSDFLDM